MTKEEHDAVIQSLQRSLERNVGSPLTMELASGIFTCVAEQVAGLMNQKKPRRRKQPPATTEDRQ
jgi:hypothetical protein